ncbi:hypothetical protein LOCC1_G007520 [Lachnellula occidentalis]|uniref:Conserved oligomeric Golgi complex subunit 2 n=1 Tax=Lachnellula occidentalis TaxID=215460 RepID=A0A8H8U4G1_9HELO|nr:hypothetical protein LOCC1_G007520 [Lachnellula occidentalis]
MSKFYFGGGSGDISSDDEDNLPYPEALPRSDFLAPDFDAPAYLSTLSERHQTLEDLRSDLRERSQALSKELLDLVNTNYEHLGSDLKGGEEKVEDVRVGLLGFKRGVEDVRGKVRERKVEVEGLLGEKKDVSKQIALGRRLLEVDARLEELEDRLMVSSLGRVVNGGDEDSWTDSEDEEDDEDELEAETGVTGTSTRKLQRFVTDYLHVERLSNSVRKEHPFISAQQSRMLRVRNTILLDLSTTLKQTASTSEDGKSRLLKILGIYRDLGAEEEAIKVLKGMKSR